MLHQSKTTRACRNLRPYNSFLFPVPAVCFSFLLPPFFWCLQLPLQKKPARCSFAARNRTILNLFDVSPSLFRFCFVGCLLFFNVIVWSHNRISTRRQRVQIERIYTLFHCQGDGEVLPLALQKKPAPAAIPVLPLNFFSLCF